MEEISESLFKLEEKELKSYSEMTNVLNELENNIKKILGELGEETSNEVSANKVSEDYENELKKMKAISKINTNFNSYYHSLKKIDVDISKYMDDKNFLKSEKMDKFTKRIENSFLDKLIIDHLIRKGNIETVKKFVEEKNINIKNDENELTLFKKFNDILNELCDKKLNKLFEWCKENKDKINELKNDKLNEIKDNIYFECVKSIYLQIYSDKSKTNEELIIFTKKYFNDFLTKKQFLNKISNLMGKILFRDENSINKDDVSWKDLINLFIDTFLRINKKSKEDNLELILLAGRFILPQVCESEITLIGQDNKDKDKNNQLIYSLELPEQLIYHNIFVCPVSKEIVNEKNPPIRLNCGHCVCKTSFDKIEKTGPKKNNIKCPICNQVGKTEDIINIKLLN